MNEDTRDAGQDAAMAPETAGSDDPPRKPDNNMVGAIVSTLCCCLPFGVASIVYAAQVNTKYSVGDYDGAEESARKSKTWMWWGVGFGVLINGLYLLMALIGVVEGRAVA